MKANSKEWWIITLGVLGATINAAVFPSFSLLFGELLQIFERPNNEILNAVHPWAALFIAIGIVSGVANFFKVTNSMAWRDQERGRRERGGREERRGGREGRKERGREGEGEGAYVMWLELVPVQHQEAIGKVLYGNTEVEIFVFG